MRLVKEILGNRALTASAVNTLSGPDFPTVPDGWGVVGLGITCTSASFSIQDIDRIRMRCGEFLACDFDPVGTYDYLTALLQRFGRNRYDVMTDANTMTSIIVPFNLFDRLSDRDADVCQLPRGRPLSLDLQIGSGPTNPTIHVVLILSNVAPSMSSQLLAWTVNVANGAVNGQVSRAPTNGILRAIGLPNPSANNPTRWRIQHSRAGDLYPGNSPLGLIASQRLDNHFTDTSVIWLPAGDDNGLPTGPNELTIEVDTGSTSLAAVEAAIWQVIPLQQPAAA